MLVVVGGHTRNIGKTSVACAIIRGIPEAGWVAVKITQYGHGICTHGGHGCDCAADPVHPYALDEEFEPNASDSGRLLAAGARRAFWLRTPVGGLAAALPDLRKILALAPHAVVESNSVMEYLQPDLYLAVLDCAQADFKTSAERFLSRADALVVVNGNRTAAWSGGVVGGEGTAGTFAVAPPRYMSAELLALVKQRL
jgi:hypothetical protein